MDRSRFLAGLIGPTLAAVAVSLLINPGLVAEMTDAVRDDYALIVIAGVATLLSGLAVVMSHNVWRGWPAIITGFGWLAVVGGLFRILFPAVVSDIATAVAVDGSPVVAAIAGVALLLGLYLSWQAFRPVRV